MSKKIYFLLFICISTFSFAQNYIFGVISDEEGREISDVVVTNMYSDVSVLSDDKGHFMIWAQKGVEIRFSRNGYERASIRVNDSHYEAPIKITMAIRPIEIEEVEITRQLTGNLAKDTKTVSKPTKIQKFEKEMASYMKKPSTASVLAPRHGEFVQPVVRGISIGKVHDQWTDVEFMEHLISTLGEDFFMEEYQLEKTEIQPFIFYVFKNFERRDIIKYGRASSADVARFVRIANERLMDYQNNVPAKTEKRRWKIKVN